MRTSDRENVRKHVMEIERRALDGDTFATKTLAVMVLLVEGFPEGDPGEPVFAPDQEVSNIIRLCFDRTERRGRR